MASISGNSIVCEIPSRNGNISEAIWNEYLYKYFLFEDFAGKPRLESYKLTVPRDLSFGSIVRVKLNFGTLTIKYASSRRMGSRTDEPVCVYYINLYFDHVPPLHLECMKEGIRRLMHEKGF